MSIPALLDLQLNRRKRLGEILIEQNIIDEEDLETALIYQKARPGTRLGTILRELNQLSDLDFIEALTMTMKPLPGFGE